MAQSITDNLKENKLLTSLENENKDDLKNNEKQVTQHGDSYPQFMQGLLSKIETIFRVL